jgi:hypothetical protein
MKTHVLSVIFFSFALIAGCGSEDSGTVGNGGATNLTTTVTFPFNSFTGVSVGGPFSVSIVPGPYSISVTVDSGLHRRLDVREEGQILKVGFEAGNNIQSGTMTVEIVMPTLESISLAGATIATISDFSGSFLEVQLAGVATLEGQNVSYDLLMANVDGVSVLLMEDVSPLPAADVNVAAVSSATVNMMDSAVLTGSAIATSSISYYGSDVSITVATDQTSSVTRLGPSRP